MRYCAGHLFGAVAGHDAVADGTGQRQLTTDPAWDDEPSWSLDGKQVYFITQRTGNRDIAVVPVDGGIEAMLAVPS